MVSVAATQVDHYSLKADVHDMGMSEHGCLPNETSK